MNTSDISKRIESAPFQKLIRAKKRFILPAVGFFLIFYFTLPLLTSYFPNLMNRPVFGVITLAWAFAFAQFMMTAVVAVLYIWKSRHYDALVEEVRKEGMQEAE
ncbi:DUF485 domain-containing protein [Paenibacillus tarimensis]